MRPPRPGRRTSGLAEHEYETQRVQTALDAARRAEAGLRYELTEPHVVRLDPIAMRERRTREDNAPHPGAN